MEIALIIFKALAIPALSPMAVGIIRKVKARMQNRQGASIIQPYYDIWKLFHKDEIIPKDASWVFKMSPFIIFAISILIPIGIPFIARAEAYSPLSDFLVIIYLVATGTFFLALAGIDSAGLFGGFGASREMTLAAITEGGLLFSMLPSIFITHTTNLALMASSTAALPATQYFPIAIAFAGYFIALLSETGRIPFDNAATHLELTMIHEAMIIEHSGKRLALLEWASANKFMTFLVLGVNLFMPWGIAQTTDIGALATALVLVLAKTVVLITVVGILESSLAKYRFFRLPDFLLSAFIFGVIALIATIL
jgi:formate hydrogenlyase subunit 4